MLVALTIALQWVVTPNRDRAASLYEYANLPNTSVQVLATGTSKVHANINPVTVWSEAGITLFDASGSSMDLRTTYHYLKYCLRLQDPDLVLLDTTMMASNNNLLNPGQKQNITNMTSMFDRFVTAADVLPGPEVERWAIPLTQFHSRLYSDKETFTVDDFMLNKWEQHPNIFLGYRASNAINAVAPSDEVPVISENLYRLNYSYLRRIIEKALSSDCKVVLISTPDARVHYMDAITRRLKNDLRSDNLPVDFIVPSDYLDSIKLDYNVDFYDPQHINISGGDKFSKWLANHLAATYPELKRKVDDSAWRHAYERYQEYLDMP